MAAATPNESSAVNLHPDSLQGSENREDRPKPAQLARDRRLESTTGKYKRRGTSNVTNVKNVPLQDRINQFPDQHLSVRGTLLENELEKSSRTAWFRNERDYSMLNLLSRALSETAWFSFHCICFYLF